MGRMFQAAITAATAATQRDIVEIVAGTDVPIKVYEITVTTSVEKDADEYQIPCKLSRRVGAFTSGSGGTVKTGYALGLSGLSLDSATIESGNTTQATGGTEEILDEPFILNRIGWHYMPMPEARLTIQATDALILAITDVTGMPTTAFGGRIIYEELVA